MTPCVTSRSTAAFLLAFGFAHLATAAGPAEPPDEEIADSLSAISVTATRVPTLIRDEPLHIEAVPAEEIAENLTVQPGNLSSLLNELPGVRIQQTAPGLGGAGIELRGMPTHQTLVLTDGLPLMGDEPDAFSLIQTLPLDLARVEVIKGAASALYGGSALGGVLNLVSKTADAAPQLLANVSSRGGRDLEGFFTEKGSSAWSGTLTAGAHDQSTEDISGEGWADLPGYQRYSLQPRVWWNADERRSLFLTAGITEESRDGGTLSGAVLPDGMSFPEALETHRFNGGAVSRWILDDGLTSNGELSATSTRLDRTFGAERVASTESNVFVEEALSGSACGQAWVLGLAFEHDALTSDVPGVNYNYNVPGLFAQDETSPTPWLKLAGSARLDENNEYGAFFSPRASALLHSPQSAWSLRASLAGGYAVPTPFVDEIDATGLGSLLPLHGLHAERATTASLDAKWADQGWDANASVFDSEIRSPLQAQIAPDAKFELVNATGPRRVPGAEVLIHRVAGPLQVIGSWSYLAATEVLTPGQRQDAPLIPRHAAELGAILESEHRGRIGAEVGYTGRQTLYEDPYRSVSEPYLEFNVLGEIHFRGFSIYLNAINLTDVRQTRFEPLVRPILGPGGNPITDVWAPVDGRTFNLGFKIP